jgi:hypothetical protein
MSLAMFFLVAAVGWLFGAAPAAYISHIPTMVLGQF